VRFAFFFLLVAFVGGCATLPPGSHFEKTPSTAFSHPEETRLGRHFEAVAGKHGGNSGYRLISVGVEGLIARVELIDSAERTLDLQYYIFRADHSGRLVAEALLRAADRGVRVRLLVDEGERLPGDSEIELLDGHPNIEVRAFNPFSYRGESKHIRTLEFMLNAPRLDYRMHNKLFVVDNAVALIGGRNIGDEYFEIDPESQFGDDDVFAAGPIVRQLSLTFDEYWNSKLAIPVRALRKDRTSIAALNAYRDALAAHLKLLASDRKNYPGLIASGEPFTGLVSGRLELVWTQAQLIYDSPDKKRVDSGKAPGSLAFPPVVAASGATQSELMIVTPFFVPGPDGVDLFTHLRERNVRVRVLTNSLEATPEVFAHAGYLHYRRPLLERGVELYEMRAQPAGKAQALAANGKYALHAKIFVFDRTRVLIGSVNFDLRSRHRNTEIGLIIDSPELAQQSAKRFAALVQPANSYEVLLRSDDSNGAQHLVWRTQQEDTLVELDREPAGGEWRRAKVQLLRLLPLDPEL
jgi:putative cardiolipin synthase